MKDADADVKALIAGAGVMFFLLAVIDNSVGSTWRERFSVAAGAYGFTVALVLAFYGAICLLAN